MQRMLGKHGETLELRKDNVGGAIRNHEPSVVGRDKRYEAWGVGCPKPSHSGHRAPFPTACPWRPPCPNFNADAHAHQ